MVQNVILHIGMHKTGSSSIQAGLKGYDDGTVRYAHFDTINHSSQISTIFADAPSKAVGAHRQSGRTEKEVATLKAKFIAQLDAELKSPAQTLIISGETISLMRKGPVEKLCKYLAEKSVKTTVVAYVRPPVGFASSAFQQRLKQQEARVADLTDPAAIPRPDYRKRFENFITAFGAENVTFVKFSKDVIQGSVVDHFCKLVGIPEGKITDSQANESLPLEAVGLMYDFNRNGPISRGAPNLLAARRNLFRTLASLYDTRFQIPVDLITSTWDRDDIAWMEQVGGFDLHPSESEMAATTGSSLQDYVTPISTATVKTLKAHLRKKGIRFAPEDTTVQLVTRLYYFFLIKGGQKG